MVEKLGLSFKDARSLNQIIDHSLPTGPEWSHQHIKLRGHLAQYDLQSRDIVECIEKLYGDPSFADSMHYKPERHYTDETLTSRVYSGMHTGDFWWETQVRCA